MTFDGRRYKREVLDPAMLAGNRPTDDLMLRYQLPPDLDPGLVARAVDDTIAFWRQQKGKLGYREIIDQLETDHHQLRPYLTGPTRQLRAKIQESQRRQAARVQELEDELRGFAEPTGMISPAMVDQIAALGHERADVLAVAARIGVTVTTPSILPAEPPAPIPRLGHDLGLLEYRHIADFVFGKEALADGFTVVDGFARPWEKSRLDEIAREWAQRPGNRKAAEGVLAVLRGLTQQQMQTLLLYQCAQVVRDRRDRGLNTTDWLRHAERLGLTDADAKRLVFAVRAEETGRVNPIALRLQELLGAGAVMAAYHLAKGLTRSDVPPEVRVWAARAEQAAREAIRLRDLAAAAGDPDAAWRLLDEAVALAPDLAGVDELRRRWPPQPPGRPVAGAGADSIVVTWTASPSVGGSIGYRLIRSRYPIGPEGSPGEVIADVTTTTHIDASPPVNVPLNYAVAAYREGAVSEAIAAEEAAWHLPAVTDLDFATSDGVIAATWRRPPGASEVLVRRSTVPPSKATDGDAVAVPPGAASFEDRVGSSGITFHYLLIAAYLGPDGSTRYAAGARFDATPVRTPLVRDIAVEPDRTQPGWLLVTFERPEVGTVELRELQGPPEHGAGTVMPVSAVPGRRIPSFAVAEGLRCRPTAGLTVLVAVTVNGDTAIIGAHRTWLAVAAPEVVDQRRHGDQVTLTWEWPSQISEFELSWPLPGLPPHRQPVSIADYKANGGAVVTPPRGGPVEISVTPMIMIEQRPQPGESRSVTVKMPVRAAYTVRLAGPRWRRRSVASVTVSQAVRIRRLVLLLARGPRMPLRIADGQVLQERRDIDASPAAPIVLESPLHDVAPPFWLRCFAEDDEVELEDPPPRQLYARRRLWPR